MNFLFQILYGVDTVLQALLLLLLLRGSFRKYTVFSLFILFGFAADVAEGIAFYRRGWESPAYRTLYWTDHVALAVLLFLVVIAFTYASLQDNPMRPKAAKALGFIVAATVALSLGILRAHYSVQHGFFTSQWFNHASQIWNFGAAIMNLVLWAALLSNRRRDPQLVTLSVGLGIATAIAAIAWGARRWLPEPDRWMVDSFMTVTHLASVLLWCWVFRPKAAARSSSTSSGRTNPPSNAPSPNPLTTPS